MQITIDTNNLSEMDIAMLGFLAGQAEVEPEGDVEKEPEAPAPAKKAAPAKAAAKPKPEPEVPTSEEAGDTGEADEDLVGGDAPTMADAVAAATTLVSSGGAAKVKAALAEVGAKRVSEMKVEDIPAFLAALDQ